MLSLQHFARQTAISALGLALLAAPGSAGAAEPEMFAAVKSALDAKNIVESNSSGPFGKTPFSEIVTKPGVLVGFEFGMGKFFKNDVICTLRPIYSTADGERVGADRGLFVNSPNVKQRTKVLRVVAVKAKPGYAVGSIAGRAGAGLDGMQLKFMRIDGAKLNVNDNYQSDWIGNRTGGGEYSIDTKGAFVVGIFGKTDDVICQTIGLYYLAPPTLPRAEVAPANLDPQAPQFGQETPAPAPPANRRRKPANAAPMTAPAQDAELPIAPPAWQPPAQAELPKRPLRLQALDAEPEDQKAGELNPQGILGVLIATFVSFFLVFVVAFIICIISCCKIYAKAGQPGWTALIPIYNTLILIRIVGRPDSWIIFSLIPFVGPIVLIVLMFDLAKSFGKGAGFALGMLFLAPIFYPMLAFGSAEYIGPVAADSEDQRKRSVTEFDDEYSAQIVR